MDQGRGPSVLDDDRIRGLAARQGTPMVTSCYLDVDGRQHLRHSDYEIQLAHLMRRARSQAAAMGPEAARAVEGDLERIGGWVRGGFDRSQTRGLALFSCAAEGYFEVIELPRAVRNEIVLERSPHVRQLEQLIHEYERFAVVLVDRQRARLFRFELGQLSETTEMFDAVPRRHDSGGWSASNIQRHTDELAHKHLKHAAEAAFAEVQEGGVRHVILGGPHEVVKDFESRLHPYVADRVVARLSIMLTASPEEVRQAALDVEDEVERRNDTVLVGRLRNAVGSGNGGVGGLERTLAALVERRVDTLIVSDGFVTPGWHCPRCRFLATMGRACPLCAADMDLVDDVIEAAVDEALANKCRVAIVRTSADLDVMGRIGALLRF